MSPCSIDFSSITAVVLAVVVALWAGLWLRRRVRYIGLYTGLALALASPSWAALTEAEQKNVEIAADVPLAVDRAEVALGHALEHGTTTEAARACLAGALEGTLRLARQADTVPAVLLGASFGGSTRAEELAVARAYRGGMLAESISTARQSIEACRAHNRENLAYQGHLEVAALSIRHARRRLANVDLTLPYSDPAFEDRVRNGQRTAFGFHGDYLAYQRRLVAARHYWRETALEVIGVYREHPIGQDTAAIASAWRIYALTTTEHHRAGALVAGVAVHSNDTERRRLAQLPQSAKVLEALRILQHARAGGNYGAPEMYLAFLWEWASIRSTSVHYRPAIRRVADSWAQQDEAAWQLMDREEAP